MNKKIQFEARMQVMMEDMPRDALIVVTGGAGFIGSTIASRLVERNRIRIIDNFHRDNISNTAIATHQNVDIIKSSVLEKSEMEDAIADADYVIHCAGIAGIDMVINNPVTTMRVNMVGSEYVLSAASKAKRLKRIICFSTSEVFGQYAFGANETDKTVIGAVGEARWTYAVSKLAEEHLALAYHAEYGLPVSILRPFNVYGPGQVGEGALRTFIRRAIKNEPIQIHGDGTQIRAWCYVDDMVRATLMALTHPGAIAESFNIGNARCVETIYGLANTVVRVLKSDSKISFIKKDYADVEIRVPSVQKAKEILGFEAEVDLEEGIRRTAEFYQSAGLLD
jgi:UDP-glucose 4-epimerase